MNKPSPFFYEVLNDTSKVRVKQGLCMDCGEERGEKGTKTRCRPCADKINARIRDWNRRKKKAKGAEGEG